MPTYRCEVLQEGPQKAPNVYFITAPGQALATLLAFALDGGLTVTAAADKAHPDYRGTQEQPVDFNGHLALARTYTKSELIGREARVCEDGT